LGQCQHCAVGKMTQQPPRKYSHPPKLRFLLLFLEKEVVCYILLVIFGGHAPQTPWVGFAEGWAAQSLLRSRTTLFASFSGKRRSLLDELLNFWGARPPNPPGSASPKVGQLKVFCEAELRFLLLFLEKEEYFL
jgi:hypothetical protein